jgi:hypothetical protein
LLAACPATGPAGRPADEVDSGSVVDGATGVGRDAAPADAATEPTDAAVVARFVTVGALAQPRTRHGAARLPDGRVLIVGGWVYGAGAWTAGVEIYDPAAGTFATTAPTSYVHLHVRATALADGRVLVTGAAMVPGGLAPRTELFDPVTMAFSPGPDTVGLHASHNATLLDDGRVLISDESAEVYAPAPGTFTVLPPPNVLGPGHEALRLGGGRVPLSGGPHQQSSGGGTRDDAEELDPMANAFGATGAMRTSRAAHVITTQLGGGALVTGGYIGLGGPIEVHESAEVYDPASHSFSTTGPMTTSRMSHTATMLADGRVLVAGGDSDGHGTAPDNVIATTASAEIYDPVARTFTATAAMATARSGHSATRLLDGAVLVVGGAATGAAERFQP